MLIKKKSLTVNSYKFRVIWDKKTYGGSFDYNKREIRIGCKDNDEREQFMLLVHELDEIAATEMMVRYSRTDCNGDFIFVYDHRQHDTKSNMMAGWLMEFLI